MRILIIKPYYKPAFVYGGPVRSVSAMAEGMQAEGATVTVITTNANGETTLDVPLSQPVDVDGVQVWYYPLDEVPASTRFRSAALAAACDQHIPNQDIVILESLWSAISSKAYAVCKAQGIPYIMAPRGQLMPWSLNKGRWKKRLYLLLYLRRYLNGAIALHCSNPLEAHYIKALGLRPRTFVVPNSIDLSRFDALPASGRFRQRYNIPADAPLLLFLGRLNPQKQPEITIHTLAHLHQHGFQAHLLMAGPDEQQLQPQLAALANDLGCADYVYFTGLLTGDEPLAALVDTDILLMPSRAMSESFGMVALEGLAVGRAVITSDGVPVGNWAAEADSGIAVAPTAEAFQQATLSLLQQPERIRQLGENGRAMAYERFSATTLARQMLDELSKCL